MPGDAFFFAILATTLRSQRCPGWIVEPAVPQHDAAHFLRLERQFLDFASDKSGRTRLRRDTCEVAPGFRTAGLVGGSLLRMALNGAEHDEGKTED